MADGKTEFLRDPETGYIYVYRDGKFVGPVAAMGEEPPAEPSHDLWAEAHLNGKTTVRERGVQR